MEDMFDGWNPETGSGLRIHAGTNEESDRTDAENARFASVVGASAGGVVRTTTKSGVALPAFFLEERRQTQQDPRARKNMSRVRSDIHFRSSGSSHASDPENLLSDTWEDSDWVKPSRHRAMAEAANGKFLQGRAAFCAVGHEKLLLTGSAVSLYFRFLQQGAIFFFVASLCAVPTLYLASSSTLALDKGNMGQRLLSDPIQLSAFSLGAFTGNNTALNPFNGELLPNETISVTVIVCDLLIGSLFALWALCYGRDIANTEAGSGSTEDRAVSIDDFSVYVTGLPADVRTREVHDFFDNLYRLDQPSWGFEGYSCFRCCSKMPVQPDAADDRGVVMEPAERESDDGEDDDTVTHEIVGKPLLVFGRAMDSYGKVEDMSFDQDETNALGTWIAETAVVRKDGAMINHFLGMKKLVRKSITMRARIKRLLWKLKSPELQHPSNTRQRRDSATQLAKARARYEGIEAALEQRVKNFDTKQDIISARPAVGAFVVFNNEESKNRCIDDYIGSDSWFWRYLQPPPLRFRGKHRLTVKSAVAPGDVMWENMEVGAKAACCRRSLTNVLALTLIAAAAVLARQYVQIKGLLFPDDLPTYSECQAWGSASAGGMDAWYASCLETANATVLPHTAASASHSPSVSVSLSPSPSPSPSPPNTNTSVVRLTAAQCTQCFCMDFTVDRIYEDGLYGIDDVFRHERCASFAENYSTGQAFVIAGAVVVVVINTLLRVVLRKMSNFERWHYMTQRQTQLAFKLMIVQTLNLGLVNVLVNMKIHHKDDDYPVLLEPLRALGFFNGAMPDTTPEWYAQVGTPILMTLGMNIVLPHLYPMFKSARQQCQRRKPADTCVTQAQLNDRYIGKQFDITTRFASALTNLTVILVFSAGIPLLLPIGFAAFFVTFCVDKWLLLRYYRQPEPCEADLARMAHRIMPLLLLAHLIFSSWMFGSTATLASSPAFPDSVYETWVGRVDWSTRLMGETSGHRVHNLTKPILAHSPGEFLSEAAVRITRSTSISHTLFFVLLSALLVLSVLGKSMRYALNLCCCCFCSKGGESVAGRHTASPRHYPPWTAPFLLPLDPYDTYFRSVIDGEEAFLEEEDVDQGWRVSTFLATASDPSTKEFLVGKKMMLLKKWSEEEIDASVERHKVGKIKKTWEVAAENSLTSYRIDANPNYADAVLEMRNSMRRKHRKVRAEQVAGEGSNVI